MSSEENILFSFGLITDIQYSDWDDRQNYAKTKWRRYRRALLCLREAVSHWKMDKCPPTFIVQLGDVIDGVNKRSNTAERNVSQEAFQAVMEEFSSLPRTPVFHSVGNHELYNFSREELAKSVFHPLSSRENVSYLNEHNYQASNELNEGESEVLYFSFSPHPRFCFVFLDTYDISILGWTDSSQKYKEAFEILHQVNQNEDLNSPIGLRGLDQRYLQFNGGIGQEQLRWLQDVLQQAEKDGQKVVIFGHIPIHPEACDPMSLLWNYQTVLEVLWHFKCVVACFHGHTHEWGYFEDEHGIHHRTFEAVVEAPLDSNAFATLHVKEDSVVIEGHGIEKSQVLRFRDSQGT